MNVASACSCSADAGSAGDGGGWIARAITSAGGEQNATARREDRRDAHGERAPRHGPRAEGARRRRARLRRQIHDPCDRIERRSGFVERDVAVAADAENAEIEAARRRDVALVARALPVEIGGLPVQPARPVARQIDVAVKLVAERAAKRGGMVGRDARVLVEREHCRARERQPDLAVTPGQVGVYGARRVTGRQREDRVRPRDENLADALGRARACRLRRGKDRDVHGAQILRELTPRCRSGSARRRTRTSRPGRTPPAPGRVRRPTDPRARAQTAE